MVRGRGNSGERRMDAAIDHFSRMGYRKADIRSTVNRLRHKDLYGKDGWPLLEENCYYVVQEALLAKEEEEKELQLLVLQEQQQEQQQQQQQQQEEEEAQQQEAAMQDAPLQNDMPMVEVHDEVPTEVVLAVEESEEVVPLIINPPAPKATLPPPADTATSRTRAPCYGWISDSESDSDNEKQAADQQHEVCVPGPGVNLPCKRKRPSRWDVREAAYQVGGR